MIERPMVLVRKLDMAAAALLRLVKKVKEVAPEMEDADLCQEMLDSAVNLEQRPAAMRSHRPVTCKV